LQIEIINYLINSKFNEDIFANLAKSIDVTFAMTSTYAKNENCKQFVLNDCFSYNVADMSMLPKTPCMFPYLICHQSKILAEMSRFFNGYTFTASYMNAILEDNKLSMDFKKEFVYVCGVALENIKGIENKLAEFIINNNCKITEGLLYKFIGTDIDESLKIGLLSVAVCQNIITDLNNFKKYFNSISDDYAELWDKTKKTVIEDNSKTRTIADYMKDKKLATYTPRKGKLYLRCS